MSKPTTTGRTLLATVTHEPFQPVRLYYTIPNKLAVTRILLGLRCLVEDRSGRRWIWLYQDEAAAIDFPCGHAELPPEVHPLHLGYLRFPSEDRLVITLRSVERATEAARFFGPIFGPRIVLSRVRVINRWFDAAEASVGLDRLDKLLDANVTRIDPKEAEEAFERAMAGTKTHAEKMRALAAHAEERRKRDVPLVEDFPLAPEEETPEFRDLAMTLQFRALRAAEHWKGNTHLTLADIIHIVVERGGRGLSVPVPDAPTS